MVDWLIRGWPMLEDTIAHNSSHVEKLEVSQASLWGLQIGKLVKFNNKSNYL